MKADKNVFTQITQLSLQLLSKTIYSKTTQCFLNKTIFSRIMLYLFHTLTNYTRSTKRGIMPDLSEYSVAITYSWGFKNMLGTFFFMNCTQKIDLKLGECEVFYPSSYTTFYCTVVNSRVPTTSIGINSRARQVFKHVH